MRGRKRTRKFRLFDKRFGGRRVGPPWELGIPIEWQLRRLRQMADERCLYGRDLTPEERAARSEVSVSICGNRRRLLLEMARAAGQMLP